MKKSKILFTVLLALLSLVSCKKDKEGPDTLMDRLPGNYTGTYYNKSIYVYGPVVENEDAKTIIVKKGSYADVLQVDIPGLIFNVKLNDIHEEGELLGAVDLYDHSDGDRLEGDGSFTFDGQHLVLLWTGQGGSVITFRTN